MQTWCKYNEPTIKRQHYNINCLNVSVNTYSIRSKTQSNTVKNISFSKWTKVNGFALQTFDRKKCESVAPHATQFKLFLDRIKSSILCRSFNSFAEKTTGSNVHYALVTTSSKHKLISWFLPPETAIGQNFMIDQLWRGSRHQYECYKYNVARDFLRENCKI